MGKGNVKSKSLVREVGEGRGSRPYLLKDPQISREGSVMDELRLKDFMKLLCWYI